MIAIELINGFVVGIEHVTDEEEGLAWMIAIHLGIIRIMFISHIED